MRRYGLDAAQRRGSCAELLEGALHGRQVSAGMRGVDPRALDRELGREGIDAVEIGGETRQIGGVPDPPPAEPRGPVIHGGASSRDGADFRHGR
jgi:hypothetical protein